MKSQAGSVQTRLIVLAASAILPLTLLFAGVAYVDYRAERSRTGQRQLALARSMSATVERELQGATAALQALALSPRLQVADFAGFRSLALRFIKTEPKGSALILLYRDGQHLVDTMVEEGGILPHRDPTVNAVLTQRVFDTGQPMISNVFKRASGGSLIVTADVPVLVGGRVIYDLSLVLPIARFTDILTAQALQPGTLCSIFDRAGITVARVPNGERFAGQSASDTLLPVLLAQYEGVLAVVTREGIPAQTAFSHTMPSGWSVAIAVPDARLEAPLIRSLNLALGVGLLGLLFSIAVATTMARRVLQPIRALTRFAANPSLTDVPVLGISELDEVAAALLASLRDRQAAMEALQGLNDELESRIRQETASRVQAQEQLAQSQRMEALGLLVGGIAHDFNNVLQAVTGGLSLIQRRAGDADAVRRLAGMAADAAARGAAITGRLLTFARRGELAAVPLAALPLLENLRHILATTLGAGIEIQVEGAPDLPDLLADKAQLETALINLAINARDAMPAGGTLVLGAVAETTAAAPHPAGLKPGAYLRLSLTDTGTGMIPAVLARASEPFFTTKGPGEGTGLGLAMARGFAEQSGGGMLIASTPNAGTCVSLWFPQAQSLLPPPQPPPAGPPDEAPVGPMRVLMVDDDSMVREVLAGELEARGFLVTTASDGHAALALLDAGVGADLLITDYAMPGMGGVTLISEARRRRPDLPALLLTGYVEAGAEAALSVLQDRLTVLLSKPISGDALAQKGGGVAAAGEVGKASASFLKKRSKKLCRRCRGSCWTHQRRLRVMAVNTVARTLSWSAPASITTGCCIGGSGQEIGTHALMKSQIQRFEPPLMHLAVAETTHAPAQAHMRVHIEQQRQIGHQFHRAAVQLHDEVRGQSPARALIGERRAQIPVAHHNPPRFQCRPDHPCHVLHPRRGHQQQLGHRVPVRRIVREQQRPQSLTLRRPARLPRDQHIHGASNGLNNAGLARPLTPLDNNEHQTSKSFLVLFFKKELFLTRPSRNATSPPPRGPGSPSCPHPLQPESTTSADGTPCPLTVSLPTASPRCTGAGNGLS